MKGKEASHPRVSQPIINISLQFGLRMFQFVVQIIEIRTLRVAGNNSRKARVMVLGHCPQPHLNKIFTSIKLKVYI